MVPPRRFVPAVTAWVVGAALGLRAVPVKAQDGCAGGAAGCASAAIAYHHRQGLPVEINLDTGWVPGGSPVQVRFIAALDGHTAVDLAGHLLAGWPTPMALEASGDPGQGTLAVDYGIQLEARVRLHLPVGVGTVDWEGAIPYVPMVDFRAMATQTFDPWAWDPVNVHAMTLEQHLADVPLTDAIVHIPGISGGLSFTATGNVSATYHSTEITFGLDAPPLTATVTTVQGQFTGGPFVEYHPQLVGSLDQTGTLHLHPGLYVTLAGHRWMIDLLDIPIALGPFHTDVHFDPALAHLGLPLLNAETTELDFGDVTVGSTATQPVYVTNTGEANGRILGSESTGPFSVNGRDAPLPPASRGALIAVFTPVSPGPVDADLTLLTNDPTTPRRHVHVRGNGLPGLLLADAGAPTDGAVPVGDGAVAPGTDGGMPLSAGDAGCGCTVPGGAHPTGQPGASVLLVLAAVSAASRGRRRDPRSCC